MNFELLIRQYLYQNKSIGLPGIGTLAFNSSAQLPADAEKYEAIPLQDLHFSYNLQQETDPDFIKFVSAHTGKIAPLAASDVESHFMLSRQFINIGKAYTIEGVGVIEKKDDGTYGFLPGVYIPVSDAATVTHKPLKVREPQPVIPKNTTARTQQVNYKNIFVIAALVILLALAAWAAYYFFIKNRNPNMATTPLTDSVQPLTDTAGNKSISSAVPATTTTTAPQRQASKDPNAYRAVFEVTKDKDRAITRTAKLQAYGTDARIETRDSLTFKLWVPLNAAPSDTARLKDSIARFLARRVFLEKL